MKVYLKGFIYSKPKKCFYSNKNFAGNKGYVSCSRLTLKIVRLSKANA